MQNYLICSTFLTVFRFIQISALKEVNDRLFIRYAKFFICQMFDGGLTVHPNTNKKYHLRDRQTKKETPH